MAAGCAGVGWGGGWWEPGGTAWESSLLPGNERAHGRGVLALCGGSRPGGQVAELLGTAGPCPAADRGPGPADSAGPTANPGEGAGGLGSRGWRAAIHVHELVLRKHRDVDRSPIPSAEQPRLRKAQQPTPGCPVGRGLRGGTLVSDVGLLWRRAGSVPTALPACGGQLSPGHTCGLLELAPCRHSVPHQVSDHRRRSGHPQGQLRP